MYALVGQGIDEANIREACEFLIDWCSCQVKAQNPGTDLLLAVDWRSRLAGAQELVQELPALQGLSVPAASSRPSAAGDVMAQADAPPASTPTSAPAGGGSSLARNVLLTLAGVALAAAILAGATLRRYNGRQREGKG